MNILDLHGIRHSDVGRKVEDFVLENETPFRIITGNSPTMQQIVREILARYNLISDYESDWNLGALIVKEKT